MCSLEYDMIFTLCFTYKCKESLEPSYLQNLHSESDTLLHTEKKFYSSQAVVFASLLYLDQVQESIRRRNIIYRTSTPYTENSTLTWVSYHFLHFLSQFLLFSDHCDHVLVDSWCQDHIERVCFRGHVANHLIMGEHVVPVQHAIVVDTLPAKRHLEF